MARYESAIRRVTPYVPGEQPKEKNIIKLNTNENPYPPSPLVLAEKESMDMDIFRRYPDPAVSDLKNVIAQHLSVRPEQVFVGVGSDDVLSMCFLTYFNDPDRPVLFPDITYSFYDVWAEMYRIPYRTVPLTADFRIDPADYTVENGGIVIANPNAPTGILLPAEEVGKIVRNNSESLVIVDEAYVDFGGESMIPYLDRYPNLLVVQTFSKSRSLAGLRIGYAVGSEELIHALEDVKYSFNSYTMNAAAIRMGTASVKDETYFTEMCARIVKTREESAERFRSMGFTVLPSKTNFLFVSHKVPAEKIFTELRERKIFVRYFKKPRIDNFLRITVGTPEQMDALFEALGEILGE